MDCFELYFELMNELFDRTNRCVLFFFLYWQELSFCLFVHFPLPPSFTKPFAFRCRCKKFINKQNSKAPVHIGTLYCHCSKSQNILLVVITFFFLLNRDCFPNAVWNGKIFILSTMHSVEYGVSISNKTSPRNNQRRWNVYAVHEWTKKTNIIVRSLFPT